MATCGRGSSLPPPRPPPRPSHLVLDMRAGQLQEFLPLWVGGSSSPHSIALVKVLVRTREGREESLRVVEAAAHHAGQSPGQEQRCVCVCVTGM